MGTGTDVHVPNMDEHGNRLFGMQTTQMIGFDHQTGKYDVVNRRGDHFSVSIDEIVISPLHLEVEEMDKPALQKV